MENPIKLEQARKVSSFNGIDIYRISTEKFKTSSIHFFFQDNLTRKTVTKNALLPAVLRRGSKEYPTLRDISMELEMLYGASFDCGVTKKGERHIIHFYTEFLSKRYIPDGTDSFETGFKLLYNIITEPVLENDHFKEDYLSQEKEKLRMMIESRVNDKMQYSVDRCLEEACRNEPFGIFDYGFVEDLENISAKELTDHYRMLMETYPLQVYLAGDISDSQIDSVTKQLAKIPRKNIKQLMNGFTEKKENEVRYVTENMNVSQGKLCFGFRTNIAPESKDFVKLMVYNGILGGGIHSKLFQNVREKASLAYYAYSRLEKFKGLMVISSGVETKNREKATEIILHQMEEIANGNISEYELESTIKSMETGVKSLGDSQLNMVDFYFSQTVSGTSDNLNDIIEKIKSVKPEDVKQTAENIMLDTVYFLTAPENSEQ